MLILLIVCVIAGGIGALLQGMIGIGTGIVIVPLLTFILPQYGTPPEITMHIALATSMAVIATNSISALMSHYYHGNIKWQLFKKIILFSISGSCLGAVIAAYMPGHYLQNLFGIFLLFVAMYMLFKKSSIDMTDAIPDLSLPKIAAGGLGIGFIASILGSGGGILMVPFLHSLKLKMRYVVGTSTLIGFPVAVVGALTYILIGLAKTPHVVNTIGYLHWPAFLAITLAGMLSVPLGVKFSTILHSTFLQRLFAVLIIFIAIKMIFF